MARLNDVYGGSFIKATSDGFLDIDGIGNELESCIVTIKGKLTTHTFDDDKQQRVASFHETKQTLGLNKTNWQSIAEITGKSDDDDWDGAKIELFVIPEPKSQTKHAVRIRKPRTAAPRQRQAPAANILDDGTPWDGSPIGPVNAAKIADKLKALGASTGDFVTWATANVPDVAAKIAPMTTVAEWGRGAMAALAEYRDGLEKGTIRPGVVGGEVLAASDIPF